MGLFSRIRGFFSRDEPSEEEKLEEVFDKEVAEPLGGDDELVDIWHGLVDDNLDAEDLTELTVDNHGMELFLAGWVDFTDEDSEDVTNARAEFFELMEAYDIAREEFDWDAWRDWYEDS